MEETEGDNPMVETSPCRRPQEEQDLRFWLENMVWYHRFTLEEMEEATGLPACEIEAAMERLAITPSYRPLRAKGAPLLVLPYPGGRHPRIGFLEGAVNPQRETKISVFTPWEDSSYVVVDLPEAIWSNLGLIYLAHDHDAAVSIWRHQGLQLPQLEWIRSEGGTLTSERTLPNKVAFGANVFPDREEVRMELWIANGTAELLTDLRVQICVMLKGAPGVAEQTNANKRFPFPFAACHDESGRRWVVTGWEQCDRVWGNEQCPCLHSDPRFPDCPPGEMKRLRGFLSFYEGCDVETELRRIKRNKLLGMEESLG